MAKRKDSKYNCKNIILIIIFIIVIFLLLFIYLRRSNNENFFSNNGAGVPGGSAILNDCNMNYASIGNNVNCNKSAWITNSKLLCGICDGTNENGISTFTMTNPKTKVPVTFYGCSNQNTTNNADSPPVTWIPPSNAQVRKMNSYFSDKLTCNFFSENKISDLCLMVGCSDSCDILLNGKRVNQQMSTYGYYYLPNVASLTSVVITSKTSISNNFGGLSVSYIWNKQLYILDNNGFENCANIINYQVTNQNNQTPWSKMWFQKKEMTQLPLWMQNWIQSQEGGNTAASIQQMRLSFNIADTNPNKNGLLNNDLVLLLGVNNSADVLLNNTIINTITSPTTQFLSIPNVSDGDVLKINGKGNNGGIYFMYIWSGFIYMLDGGINAMNNFNDISTTTPLDFNIINQITYMKTNLNEFSYRCDNYISNPFFVNKWLAANDNNFGVSVTLKSGTENYGVKTKDGSFLSIIKQDSDSPKVAPNSVPKRSYTNNGSALLSKNIPVIQQYTSKKSDYNSISVDCESECDKVTDCNSYTLSPSSTNNKCNLYKIPLANSNDTSSTKNFMAYAMNTFETNEDNYKSYTVNNPVPNMYTAQKNYKQKNNVNYIAQNKDNIILPDITESLQKDQNGCKTACSMISNCKGYTVSNSKITPAPVNYGNGETYQPSSGYSCRLLSSISGNGISDNKMDTYIL